MGGNGAVCQMLNWMDDKGNRKEHKMECKMLIKFPFRIEFRISSIFTSALLCVYKHKKQKKTGCNKQNMEYLKF